jgi:hypothetical protein
MLKETENDAAHVSAFDAIRPVAGLPQASVAADRTNPGSLVCPAPM